MWKPSSEYIRTVRNHIYFMSLCLQIHSYPKLCTYHMAYMTIEKHKIRIPNWPFSALASVVNLFQITKMKLLHRHVFPWKYTKATSPNVPTAMIVGTWDITACRCHQCGCHCSCCCKYRFARVSDIKPPQIRIYILTNINI